MLFLLYLFFCVLCINIQIYQNDTYIYYIYEQYGFSNVPSITYHGTTMTPNTNNHIQFHPYNNVIPNDPLVNSHYINNNIQFYPNNNVMPNDSLVNSQNNINNIQFYRCNNVIIICYNI